MRLKSFFRAENRYKILLLVFISVVINYVDRSNLSIAAHAISEDFKLTPSELGLLFSAFGWAYAMLQIPGGILADIIAPRILYSAILILWSLATVVQGLSNSFLRLLGLRVAIGVFEAPSFPLNNRVITEWFPRNERAFATGIYTSGQFVGLAFLTPILVLIQHHFNWHGLFFVTGMAGVLWGIIWYIFYRKPARPETIKEERIAEVQEKQIGNDRKKISRKDLKKVFSYRKLWGIYIGQFAVSATLWFFLTWFPTYLTKYRGIEFLESGFLISIPFLAAFAGVLLSGIFSDYLLKKGFSITIARKTPVIVGLVLSSLIIGANYVASNSLVILFLTISFLGTGFASITWVFVSELAPLNLIGTSGGVFNFMGNLSAIIVPFAIGLLITETNFSPAIWFIAIIELIGIFSYIFIVGKVQRVE